MSSCKKKLNKSNSLFLYPRGGGTPHMKGVGMLVVSLKVFWAKRHHI